MQIETGKTAYRWSPDGLDLVFAAVIKPDEELEPGKRWIVDAGEGLRRWHAASILGCLTLDQFKSFQSAIRVIDHLRQRGFEEAAHAALIHLAEGTLRP